MFDLQTPTPASFCIKLDELMSYDEMRRVAVIQSVA